nr:DUF5694 domain-containing protein [uncultured Sphingomonas sp.]
MKALAAALILVAGSGHAQSPLGPNPPIAGSKTRVMTLGTFHMSELEKFDATWLEPLLTKLAAYHPQVITVESVSGEQCAMMKANPDRYADAFEGYCWDLTEIEKSTGFSTALANAEIRKTLANWPAVPTAAQRRRLAMLFVAAGDRSSAQVQWLRLLPTERREGDGIDANILKILQRTSGKSNENYDVAATLAARLGLERVFPVDDHSADAPTTPEFDKAQMTRFEEYHKLPVAAEWARQKAAMKDAASVLAWYRHANSRGGQDRQIRADFGGALAQKWPGTPGRQYMGWWETRNLRMAANIRDAFAAHPGTRVLNIVGASHKPWYDAFMGQMADVDVVDASTVLR